MIWNLLRSLLFRFDAEKIHDLTHFVLRFASQKPLGKKTLVLVSGSGAASRRDSSAVVVLGMPFRSQVGLAAGFDKNAELLGALSHLGFGFAEIGTVTPKPQAGNPKPRLFRDSQAQTIFNRMGFNGQGAIQVARNLERARLGEDLPLHFRVGVNLGKNKDTSAENAHLDYAEAARAFRGLADYIVINVSSPNTPGLRDLQTSDALKKIISAVQAVIGHWEKTPPLLLKLAPELSGEKLKDILHLGERSGVSGWVLTNTWGGERKNSPSEPAVSGGWSGSILTEKSLARLAEARSVTSLPIISSGGIMNAEDARIRLRTGASLIQVYTGWIYGGPRFLAKILKK